MSIPAIRNRKPIHDRVVLMYLQGMRRNEIATMCDMHPSRVYQILKDPVSQSMVVEARRRLAITVHERIESRMVDGGEEAVSNLLETIEADVPVQAAMKKHQDRMSLELLDRIGHGKEKQQGSEEGIRFDRDLQERMVSALEQANEKKQVFDMAEEAEWHAVEEDEIVEDSVTSRIEKYEAEHADS
jgi:hypothetical protein